jgi:(4-O-methyl)-D-glucuronate---lignin esterase
MIKKILKKSITILFFSLIFFLGCRSNNNSGEFIDSSTKVIGNLEDGFKNPPNYARPRVFWWWLNSMATKESITRDLKELKSKGFGGALLVDAGSSNYSVAKKTKAGPVFGSPEWKKLFAFALKEADSLGLELSFNIQSGWNLGGPTVTSEDAMKKIVWSEKHIIGPVQFSDTLPMPEGKYYHDIVAQAFHTKKGSPKSYLLNWQHKTLNDRFRGFDVYPLYELREQADSLVDDFDFKSDALLDISKNLDTNGVLKWSVPPGDWTILRIGFALTEAKVSTSSDGYDGLALDYLNTNALKHFFAEVVDPILKSGGDNVGKSLKYLTTDSWEMGQVNWTKNFRNEFLKRRGFDPLPYLSIVTGQIVDNREISNRFLYDFRKTVSDCIADRMYTEFGKLAHERGLLFHPESGGPHAAPIDGLKCLGRNDIPMGEYWARSNTHRYTDDQRLFVKQSASATYLR